MHLGRVGIIKTRNNMPTWYVYTVRKKGRKNFKMSGALTIQALVHMDFVQSRIRENMNQMIVLLNGLRMLIR